jgi:hypothetical protein
LVSADESASDNLLGSAKFSDILLVGSVDRFELVNLLLECLYLILQHQYVSFLPIFANVFVKPFKHFHPMSFRPATISLFRVKFVLIPPQTWLAHVLSAPAT